MTTTQMFATKAKPAASLGASGLALTLLGGPLLLAAGYFGMLAPLDSGKTGPSAVLAIAGWVLIVAGAALLVAAAYRALEHLDRLGGVTYTVDAGHNRTWTSRQPETSSEAAAD